jgi:bidirectional [NiFe] hydrogenase diaphorase subunit
MTLMTERKAPPSEDRRWKLVRATMQRFHYSPKALIETLHTVQDAFGYIDEEALSYVSENLQVPPSKVYGVTTFYNQFTMKPAGEHTFSLCTGTACYVKGNDKILEFMKEEFGLEPGQTTPDERVSFVSARCVGACGLAPVMILDGQVMGKMSVEVMKDKIREWMKNE